MKKFFILLLSVLLIFSSCATVNVDEKVDKEPVVATPAVSQEETEKSEGIVGTIIEVSRYGNTYLDLLVSDYGQLELRVLAHMTKCVNMIEAFHLGGDFHSRTGKSSSCF